MTMTPKQLEHKLAKQQKKIEELSNKLEEARDASAPNSAANKDDKGSTCCISFMNYCNKKENRDDALEALDDWASLAASLAKRGAKLVAASATLAGDEGTAEVADMIGDIAGLLDDDGPVDGQVAKVPSGNKTKKKKKTRSKKASMQVG